MKRKTKNIITKTLTAVLAVGVVAGTAAAGKALYDYSKDDLKTIHPIFNVGGLDENGKYVEQDTTLYTKEAFECKGLDIKLDFDNDIKYQIFFYESDGDFVESTEILEEDYVLGKYEKVEVTHARVMIIPKWTNVEETEDKTLEELQVVDWKNINSFAKQITIKVLKEQKINMIDVTLKIGTYTYDISVPKGMTWEEYLKSSLYNSDYDLNSQGTENVYYQDKLVYDSDGVKIKVDDVIRSGLYVSEDNLA